MAGSSGRREGGVAKWRSHQTLIWRGAAYGSGCRDAPKRNSGGGGGGGNNGGSAWYGGVAKRYSRAQPVLSQNISVKAKYGDNDGQLGWAIWRNNVSGGSKKIVVAKANKWRRNKHRRNRRGVA